MNLPPSPAPSKPKTRTADRRGSVMILVLFITAGLLIRMATVMQAGVSEDKFNTKAITMLEAKNAAEAAASWTLSNIEVSCNTLNYPSANYFVTSPVANPITNSMNASVCSWLWPAGNDINAANVTYATGTVGTFQNIYIDPGNPVNNYDPQVGKWVTATDIYVYTSATATRGSVSDTVYAQEALEVRNGSLFANAVFYNMDMEYDPGPAMTITGTVHANGNIWAVAQTGLTYSAPITASGNFNVGLIPWPTSWGSSVESAMTGELVHIPNATGNGTSTPYTGAGSQQLSSSYYDSRQTNFAGTGYTNFLEYSANKWGGNLQTSVNNVPTENVLGYNNYQFNANGSGTDLNYAYALIEPVIPSTDANFFKGAGENNKMERNAGLIINVAGSGTLVLASSYTSSAFTNVGNCNGSNTTIIDGLLNSAETDLDVSGNLIIAANDGNFAGELSGATYIMSNTVPAKPDSHAVLIVTQTQNGNGKGFGAPSTTFMEVPTFSVISTTGTALATGAGNTTTLSTLSNGLSYNIRLPAKALTVTTSINRTIGCAWVIFQDQSVAVDPVLGTRTLNYVAGTPNLATGYNGDVITQNLTVNPAMLQPGGTLQNLITYRPAIGNLTNSGNLDMWNGLYDGRRAQEGGSAGNIQSLDVDMGALKLLLDNGDTGGAGQAATANAFFTGVVPVTNIGTSDAYSPQGHGSIPSMYNGVVYVQFPQQPESNFVSREAADGFTINGTWYPGDQITLAQDGWGLVVGNATTAAAGGTATTGVPNPSYNNPTLPGQGTRTAGFTLATNGDIYVSGNYNADGVLATGNATSSDSTATPDPSCALVADSVTLLSGAWTNRKSQSAPVANRTATNDEVSTAIIAGICPSLSGGGASNQSGGVHNFPRFLEYWSGTVQYRGSMVSLYESQIPSSDQPWTQAVYSAPTRNWGYFNQFGLGKYPPGTPNVRTYYRVSFQFLSQAQYNAAIAAIP